EPALSTDTAAYSKAPPVKSFICPSRRTIAVGARIDYCGAYSPGIAEGALTDPPASGGAGTGGNYKTILNAQNTNMSAVTNPAGPSNTILVAHKTLKPSNYGGNSHKDYGYTNTIANQDGYDHMRWADKFGGTVGVNSTAGHGYVRDDETVDENHMGGSHNS